MKGQRIFNETVKALALFDAPGPEELERKNGRDAELIVLRNEQIMHRYYFYTAYGQKRWDAIVELLSGEFYLAEYTITNIVTTNAIIRRKLMNEKPTVAVMRERYPLAKW